MILCLFCIATAKADNEPGNNTPGTTTDVLALGGASQNGSVTLTTDNDDYFKIITTAEGDITINITAGNGNLVYYYLYDNDGTTQLGGTYFYGGTSGFTANGLSAGTYFVRVNLSSAGTNTYTLSGTLTPRTYANDVEPNDVFTNASTIALNGTKTGHITHRYNGGTYDADDWYKVITNADGNLDVNELLPP